MEDNTAENDKPIEALEDPAPAPAAPSPPVEPEPAPEKAAEPEHPVQAAVKTHLSERIIEALEDLPEEFIADFNASVSWIKDHL